MRQVEYDREILYVYKLYYWVSIQLFFTLVSCLLIWLFSWQIGSTAFLLGLFISYLLMIRKNDFPVPDKKRTAQRMAREITQNESPLAISRFASQLYFYLNEAKQAITLLEKYLNTGDPLLCATLADILLREGRPKQALNIIRENPNALTDPLLLSTQGHLLQQIGKFEEAVKVYEKSLYIAKETGFPHNGASHFTQILLTLSYKASIHHQLADCYFVLKDYAKAKKHYRSGNFRLLDFTMWRKFKLSSDHFAKNYTKSH